jgi:transposase
MALASSQPDWVQGFLDETWWSRFAHPNVHTWCVGDEALRLVQQSPTKADPDPKALACYGMLVRWTTTDAQVEEQTWLRFVDDRPVSCITTQFLDWCCGKLEALGKRVLALFWDNASWHISWEVCNWIRAHNRQVKREGPGVRILVCRLPTKSPWLNPIEPKWAHGKRCIVEPEAALSAEELVDRVCAVFDCEHEPHLSIPKEVA